MTRRVHYKYTKTSLIFASETRDVCYVRIATSTPCLVLYLLVIPVANVIKLFMTVSYDFSILARAFVPGKPFHLSLMFLGKAGAYPSEAPFIFSNLW
jgi:hypothetical protein